MIWLLTLNNKQRNNNLLLKVEEGVLEALVKFELQSKHVLHVVHNLLYPAIVTDQNALCLAVVQEERQDPE